LRPGFASGPGGAEALNKIVDGNDLGRNEAFFEYASDLPADKMRRPLTRKDDHDSGQIFSARVDLPYHFRNKIFAGIDDDRRAHSIFLT
jgi:hypothetical protein